MTEHKSCVFRFGDIEVRESEFALTRAGETVRVEPTAFRVLLYLLRNPGRLVTKDEIMAAVWHNTAVSDNSLTRSVATLRRVLDDDSREPRYIATAQTLGYRFMVPVERSPGDAVPRSEDGPGQAAKEENGTLAARPTAVPPPPAPVKRPAPPWPIAAGAVLLVALVVAGSYLFHNRRSHARADSAYPSFVKAPRTVVTVPGIISYAYPALSPDGRQIAFIWRTETGHHDDLYVQLIGADQPLRLTHNASGFICCAAWSPDGRQIAYAHCGDNGGAVFVVPAMGGVQRKITEVACPFTFNGAGWPQWTADADSLVLADQCAPKGPRGIVLFSLLTGEKRCLTSPPSGVDSGDTAPALSPDRKTVAFFRTSTLTHDEVYTVDISGKNLHQLTHYGYGVSSPLMWTVDGNYVVFNSGTPDMRFPARVSVQGGPIEPASTFPAVGSLSTDGRHLAYVEGTGSASIWRVELASAGGKVLAEKNISISSYDDSPQLAPDGEHLLVRSARGGGKTELWRTDIDGQNPVQLTRTPNPGWIGSPHGSPDGKWIAMDYRPGDHSQIWMVDSEGRNFRAVIADQYENFVPRWSRDGRSIYFTSNRSGELQIWKLDLASGQKIQITDQGGISGFESHDASALYYTKREFGGLWRRPLSGGPEVRVTDALHLGYWGAFALTDSGIYFLDADSAPLPAILFYDFQTGRTRLVVPMQRFFPYAIPTLTASRDGRILFVTYWDAVLHIQLAEASP